MGFAWIFGMQKFRKKISLHNKWLDQICSIDHTDEEYTYAE